MKNQFKYLKLCVVLFALTSALFVSCDSDAEPMKSVDLRFEVEDEYNISHTSPEAILFRVRSTDAWRVYSDNSEWCTITPDTGEADPIYDPDKDYNVTVQYENNESLDDRYDVLTIQSDYWVGKRITVCQKGIAYLDVNLDSLSEISKDGGEVSFDVLANQNWTAKVVTGESWLTITSDTESSLDGAVSVSAGENYGEIRYGEIMLCDRLGEQQHIVEVVQGGVILDVEKALVRVYHEEQLVRVAVKSNSSWSVEKANESVSWLDLTTTEFEGDGEIVIDLSKNEGSTLRETTFVVSTISTDGTEPISKEFTLCQAYLPETTRNEFTPEYFANFRLQNGSMDNMSASGTTASFINGFNRVAKDKAPIGRYTFCVEPTNAAGQACILFYEATHNVQIVLASTGKANFSGTSGITTLSLDYDRSVSHTIGLEYSQNLENGLCDVSWYLDDELVMKYVANSESGFIREWESIGMLIFGGTGSGNVDFYWMEFTPAIDWGE